MAARDSSNIAESANIARTLEALATAVTKQTETLSLKVDSVLQRETRPHMAQQVPHIVSVPGSGHTPHQPAVNHLPANMSHGPQHTSILTAPVQGAGPISHGGPVLVNGPPQQAATVGQANTTAFRYPNPSDQPAGAAGPYSHTVGIGWSTATP